MQKTVLIVLATASVAGIAQAQQLPGLGIGVSAGVYLPSNSLIKHLFGSTEFNYGVSPFGGASSAHSGFAPEISVIDGNNNGNKFLLIPLALAYEFDASSAKKASTVPYARLSAGITYFDYSINLDDGAHYGVKRFGGTTGLEVGLKFSGTAKVYAKYDLFTVEQHFNFSGLELGGVISLGKL